MSDEVLSGLEPVAATAAGVSSPAVPPEAAELEPVEPDAQEIEALLAPAERAQRFLLGWPRMVIGIGLGLAVALLIIRLANLHLIHGLNEARLATHQPIYLVLAFLCVIVYLVADAFTLIVLVRVLAAPASARQLTLIAMRAHFVGGTTSFGGMEIPYQAFALRRQGMTLTNATSAVLVKGVVHATMLVAVALAALIPISGSPITPLQRWIVLGFFALLVLSWAVASIWVRRPAGVHELPGRVRQELHAAREAFAEFHQAGLRVWVLVLLSQVVYWVALFAIIPLILHALGWRGSIAPIVTSQAVLQVLMPLSPLAGGAGVAELGYLALIGPSTPAGIRVSSLLLWRVATWVIPVFLGAVAFGVRGGESVQLVRKAPTGQQGDGADDGCERSPVGVTGGE